MTSTGLDFAFARLLPLPDSSNISTFLRDVGYGTMTALMFGRLQIGVSETDREVPRKLNGAKRACVPSTTSRFPRKFRS